MLLRATTTRSALHNYMMVLLLNGMNKFLSKYIYWYSSIGKIMSKNQ